MPVNSKSVKINRKGQVFVKQGVNKKKRSGSKAGQYVPYDMQNGVRRESDRKSDIDEDENYAMQRQLSR